ncbi:uncharacterized protein LOC111085217 [Limulus polyphemus]|uniref:Uncharacterized protein LOC111085217 n=1 Tax=Limulus polyphemus TaxID=6850 RepID=A0ABM1S4E6_LIMPO|nr:uncharacterized protein LOC111085217 [Limulus polyphemus]
MAMTISLIKKFYYIMMDENLYRKQKALGVLPNVNDEDEESRFRLLRESMLKLLHISESEKNDSTDDDDNDGYAINAVSSKSGARNKRAGKPKLTENRRSSSGEKGPLKHGKEYSASTRRKSSFKKTCKLTEPLKRSSSATSLEHIKRKPSADNSKGRTHDRSWKLRTRRTSR